MDLQQTMELMTEAQQIRFNRLFERSGERDKAAYFNRICVAAALCVLDGKIDDDVFLRDSIVQKAGN
jgi:hypothetical protein